MRKISMLTALVLVPLYADQTMLEPINVEAPLNSIIIDEVRTSVPKSADLAEDLYKNTPSINMIRRSGIANDIVLRGQKRDNINVLIDGAKVYGACPNRMDPVTSHVITTAVDSVQVSEGPFDVENSGTLSGIVKITTQEPTKELSGEIGANVGSFGYWKTYANASGGSDDIKVVLNASKEQSGQYLDGNGKDFDAQMTSVIAATSGALYQDQYASKLAFDKNMFMGKLFWDISNNQTFKTSYMLNRSSDILYPSSSMDALWDNSDIITASYTLKELASFSKEFSVDAYYSTVDHPMVTTYRKTAVATPAKDMKSHLTSSVEGLKLKNSFDLGTTNVIIGADLSNRRWDGNYSKNSVPLTIKSLDTVNTLDTALFAKASMPIGRVTLDAGVRYDRNAITTASSDRNNTYNNVSGNIVADYAAMKEMRLFVGVGHSVRVPDARELYFTSSMGVSVGTSDLKEVHNSEVDAGGDLTLGSTLLKGKVFYSLLNDFIYYNASSTTDAFVNIDAYIFGGEASVHSKLLNGLVELDASVAMQRGKKTQALAGQNDLDLADITPIKANASLTYNFAEEGLIAFDMIASDTWRWYDEDNGEQAINAYAVFNVKYKQTFAKTFDLALGVNNIFNSVYQVSNTYKDLNLITTTTNDVMLFNEPGTYLYANVAYKF